MEEPQRIKDELRRTYDEIAPYFSEKRKGLWPPMEQFIDEVSPCTIGDLGCGTGRALIHAASKGCFAVGVDVSSGQLEIARKNIREKGLENDVRLVSSDLEHLELEDRSLDHTMMIASLHHLPTREMRIKGLEEAYRCTRRTGRILISVWSWDQKRFREFHLSRVRKERPLGELDGPLSGDIIVPWKEGVKRKRFYHLYGPGELRSEIEESEWTLQRSYFDGRNHWSECIKAP
ncbi:MAG: class I SAM-dependent methyltransferase [Thermoplasmatota archaeon]